MKRFLSVSCILPVFLVLAVSACARVDEVTREEYESNKGTNALISKTVQKPWKGEAFSSGKRGGSWSSSITSDPKSFNLLISERDGETSAIVSMLCDYLLDYDYVRHEFRPNCASAETVVDEKKGTMTVVYTLRDDLFWSFYKSDKKVKVTTDDVVFWYNEIEGDPEFHSSAYNSQFVTLADGSEARVTIEKIDDRKFAFHFPRLDSNPYLSTNRNFGPRFLYEAAKKSGGVKAVQALFNIDTDPKTIPSMGQWFLAEYTPGQRLVFKHNPDYWNKDSNGEAIPYPDEEIVQIVPDQNTQLLLFKKGKQEKYVLRPEDLDEIINAKNPDYTVFGAGGSLGAMFWSFNQNPKNKDSAYYGWFTKKEFRQAMSCLVNRDRMIAQVYRGLAEPKLTFFSEPNPFYDPSITLQYLYDPEKAVALLASIGMKRDGGGIMRDDKGHAVEFDLTLPGDVTTTNDMCSIIADEASKIGIKINLRALDFQKMVEQLTSTYAWQSLMIGFGANYWPTQGSNVWPSNGNLHLWYPLQEKPATDWEARIDYLYNEGSYTVDHEKARRIWNEYQRLILEQCPLIYMVRPQSFVAVRNRWDFTNLYYDNIGGLQTDHVWLRKGQ
jgi:peptide/nickel transport system substrate-binding protein